MDSTIPARESEADLYREVRDHIRWAYEGVFGAPREFEQHFDDYVGLDLSREQLETIRRIGSLPATFRLLDMGCGFGSFVLVCQQAGIEATGVDIADADLAFARRRFAEELSGRNPSAVYLAKDSQSTDFPDQSFDVVTAWNLLEHVADFRKVVAEAYRLLRPGGLFCGVAPNYCSFRKEAHYHVPWLPLLPRRAAANYLRLLGRRPDFFERDIHYVTNAGILLSLRKRGFHVIHRAIQKLECPDLLRSVANKRLVLQIARWRLTTLVRMLLLAAEWNPFKPVIWFAGTKPA